MEKESCMKILESISVLEHRLLKYIIKKESVTKEILIEALELKRTTLNRSLNHLLELGFITVLGNAESSGGRKPQLFGINTNKYHLVGIDISRSYAEIVLCDLQGKIKGAKKYVMDETMNPKKLCHRFMFELKDMLKETKILKRHIIGVGLGAVGPLDRKDGRILNPTNFNNPEWLDVPIVAMLEASLKLSVKIDNGANTALWGESFRVDLENKKIAYFNVGLGIRSGFFSGSEILRATNNLEDAFGHMTVNVNGLPCHCGKNGCIENYCTITSLLANSEFDSFESLCKAYREGNETVKNSVKLASHYFGNGLANYINILGPNIVLISGPLVHALPGFFEELTKVVKDSRINLLDNVLIQNNPYYGNQSIAIGAALMCLEG